METQNEAKAKEIMNKFYGKYMPNYAKDGMFNACFRGRYDDILEAMEWKDEQNTEFLVKIKNALEDMVQMCDKLTSGNIAHQRPHLKGFAKGWVELIDEYLETMKGE